MKEFTIVASEMDTDLTSRTGAFRILAQDWMQEEDVLEAIREASFAYCQTPEGRKTYEGNCNNFNIGDFEAYVPASICMQFGIEKLEDKSVTIDMDFNEQLVMEEEVFPEKMER